MHFKIDELLLLEMITYFSDKEPLVSVLNTSAKTVGEYINSFNLDEFVEDEDYASYITGFDELTICEDVTEHYQYWQENINFNKNDCCNLRFLEEQNIKVA